MRPRTGVHRRKAVHEIWGRLSGGRCCCLGGIGSGHPGGQHPANAILNSAVANLSSGNKGGTDGIIATNTVFEALGLSLPGAYNTAGAYVGSGTVDGVVLLNLDQPLSFTQPLPAYNGRNCSEYDATRAIEHEIDEVLGGGGSGTTLNDIAYYGKNNRADPFTYYQGPLDLYRYNAAGRPSFSTNPSLSYFSVNGGKTNIVGFNQYAQGDLSDFGPTVYPCSGGGIGGPPGFVQDAFSCPNQTGEAFTTSAPEYLMLEALVTTRRAAHPRQVGSAAR